MAALSNTKHELFAQKTVELDNQTEAFRIAFPHSKKWKDKTVWSKASTLASTEKVQERIKAIRESLSEKMMISKEEMVKTLKTISEVSITDYYEEATDDKGNISFCMIPPTKWTEAMGKACTKLKPLVGGGFELTVHGTEYPYKELNKMLGHYAPKEVKVESDSIASLLGDIIED